VDPRGEWRRGWGVVLSAGVGFSLVTMHYAIVSVLMKPLSETYGWSRTQVTAGLTVATLIWPIFAFLVGKLADRVGARRVALAGVCGVAGALAGIGFAGPEIWTWWLAWALFPVFAACASPVVWTLAVASRFEKSRALALAVSLSVNGVVGAIVPIMTSLAYDAFGLRGAFWAMAAGGLLIVLPCVWFLFYDARDLARTQGRRASVAERSRPVAVALAGMTLKEALMDPRFWRLGLALLLVSAGVGTMGIHLQAMLTDGGLTRTQAAAIGGFTGPAVVIGRISTGFLLDRFYAPAIAAVAFALPGVSCLLLLGFHGSSTTAIAIVIIAGLGAGAELDVVAYLTSRYFGMKQFGVIYACMFGLYTLGVGAMPLAGGLVYDTFGSYDRLLVGLVAALAVGSLLAMTLGRFPVFSPAESPDPG
jgi:MFS family permease